MKLKLIYLCTLVFAIAFTACKKDEPPVKPQPANSMTAKVDGVDWVAAWPVATNDMGDFSLAGVSMDGKAIGMYAIQANISAPGTYPVKGVYSEVPVDSTYGPT